LIGFNRDEILCALSLFGKKDKKRGVLKKRVSISEVFGYKEIKGLRI